CHRLEVISQTLLKVKYTFFSVRLMLVADKQALSAFPSPLSRWSHCCLVANDRGSRSLRSIQ
ncbi:hypothetical protein, partial [Siminovitchia terrae]|uniref:hypothetical protein n=1 Tax=Siminovitchia terrae TaxID=1914933 RepID=UPI0028A81B66